MALGSQTLCLFVRSKYPRMSIPYLLPSALLVAFRFQCVIWTLIGAFLDVPSVRSSFNANSHAQQK